MEPPHTPEVHLNSLAPHVAQHETEFELLSAQAKALDAELAEAGSAAVPQRAAKAKAGTKATKKTSKRGPVVEERSAKDPPDQATLRAERERVEQSIATHKMLIELGRDARVGATLAAVAADRELARLAAADPVGFAAERGIALPENMRLNMQVDDSSMSLRISHYDPDVPFVLVWTPEGFQPPVEHET
jgi:hypothetical protein